MNIDDAISQISEIHGQLAKTEIFYGYKPAAVLWVGISAFVVSAIQRWLIIPANEAIFIIQWLAVGSIIILIMGGNIFYRYITSGDNFEIQKMSRVFVQFVPSILAGLILSIVFIYAGGDEIAYLPGIWSLLFCLGIFSMRPYLPKMIGWVACFYLLAGGVLLYLAVLRLSFNPWGMGITFGTGHLLASLILKLDIKRTGI